jgi:hypothetical protein
MRYVIAALVLLIALTPRSSYAGACDEWLRETVKATGSYVPAQEAYARPFVFALELDCKGTKELVTVQRATGNLPVCEANQNVEVIGRLTWNWTFFGSHYEIKNPTSVICRPREGSG